MKKPYIRALPAPWALSVNYYIMDSGEKQETFLQAKPIEFQEFNEATLEPEPTFRLSEEASRQLMNDLWAAGYRPTSHHSQPNEAALQDHIKDLRTIAFKTLKIEN